MGSETFHFSDPGLQAPEADVFATNSVRRFVSNRGFDFCLVLA